MREIQGFGADVPPPALTAAGRRRRVEIAGLALGALRARRRRRRTGQALALAVAIVLVGIGASAILDRRRSGSAPEVAQTPPSDAAPPREGRSQPPIEILDDRGLLEALAEAGHHACLLRTAGGVQLVPPLPD